MNTAMEIAANAVTTASILLAGRNSVHTWWTGIVGCLLFGYTFYETQLYADVVLQLFFVATSVVGWRHWLKGDDERPRVVTRAGGGAFVWMVPAGLAATLGYGALLHYHTDAYAPFADSAVMAFSVIAQLLLMRRCLESWPFWLLVNTIAVPLYASRGLYLTACLYSLYWVNAIVSWFRWRRLVAMPGRAA